MRKSFDLQVTSVTAHTLSMKFQNLYCIGLGREGTFSVTYMPEFDPVSGVKQLRIRDPQFSVTRLIPRTNYIFSITKANGTMVSQEAMIQKATLPPTSE